MDGLTGAFLYIKSESGDWHVGEVGHHTQRNWRTDPFGYDLYNAYWAHHPNQKRDDQVQDRFLQNRMPELLQQNNGKQNGKSDEGMHDWREVDLQRLALSFPISQECM